MLVSRIAKSVCRFSEATGPVAEPSFLKMVEGYFNKAAKIAGLE
jgi:hypothetical protein